MMLFTSLITAVFAMGVSSNPVQDTNLCRPVNQNADFDDLTALPVLGQGIGIYKGLSYQGLTEIAQGVADTQVTAVRPNSRPNLAVARITEAIIEGPPTLLAQYKGSKTVSFDLTNFYFGCSITTLNSLVSPPKSCNVTVKGYRANVAAAQQSFAFKASGALQQDMVLATLNREFKGLTKVTFDVKGGILPTAFLLDSLKYSVCQKK